MRLGEGTMTATAGTFVLVPRGTVHTFKNSATTPARMLTIMSPPMDRFRAALTELMEALPAGSQRHVNALDLAVVRAIEERYGVRDEPA
jgi:hypothetical protein